jgi:sugar phosphate isomerase/epimerase
MKIGATTIPLAGWVADPRRPQQGRAHRLAAIRQLVTDYGLSAVELSLDLGIIFPQVFTADFYAAVAALQQELGFVCTVHLPFLWLDLASLNEPIRRSGMDCLRQAIQLTQPVEISTYVVHLWGLTTIQVYNLLQHPAQRQAVMAAVMAQAERSLAELCQILDPQDACVENLESPPFDVVLPLVERYGASICLDVGHLAWQRDSELEFLARHGSRIREVHLHDAVTAANGEPGGVRDHLALGQGELDHRAFLHELEKTGYQGTVILELNSQKDLEESVNQVRRWK